MDNPDDAGGADHLDHGVLEAIPLEALCPGAAPDCPDVDWADNPASAPAQLYADHYEEVAGETVHRFVQVIAQEPAMTADLLAACPLDAWMHGLEFRLKSPASYARKRSRKLEQSPDFEVDEVADGITDLARYTIVSASASTVITVVRDLVDDVLTRGWSVLQVENSFIDDNPYKALHVLLANPDGVVCELQFHTEQSQQVKDCSHLLCEIVRDTGTPAAERAKPQFELIELWRAIPAPDGLDEFTELGGCVVDKKYY